jgi:hypothetical protein
MNGYIEPPEKEVLNPIILIVGLVILWMVIKNG